MGFSGGLFLGGIYSGLGVIDNGDGIYDFNLGIVGFGVYIIFYIILGICEEIVMDDIEVLVVCGCLAG